MTGDLSILVVGAGPVGLTAALSLARKGVRVRVIEKQLQPSHLSKAIGINARTQELFRETGLTERFSEAGHRISGASFLNADGQPLFEISFDDLEIPCDNMIALPQSETEAILEEALRKLKVPIKRGCELIGLEQDGEGVTAQVRSGGETREVRTPLLIGCDGADSTVRQSLGIGFPGSTMKHEWSLADVRLKTGLPPDRANVVILPQRMLFAIRIREDLWRVASDRPGVLENLPNSTEAGEVLWESAFRVSHRQATRFSEGRVYLAGDAAHIHSPLGARGMNLGIEDAFVLVEKLVSGVPQTYSPERMKTASHAIRQVKLQTLLATSRNPIATVLRRYVVPYLLSISSLRQKITRESLGLEPI